ncbi:MAG: hypothetical protein WKF97_05940 [Chitinophagaceae bacterium]
MEWFFATVLLVSYFFNQHQIDSTSLVLFGLAAWLLILQTFWLLPALVSRANMVISGKTLAASSLHSYFIGAEVIKLGSLLILGFRLFKGFVVR